MGTSKHTTHNKIAHPRAFYSLLVILLTLFFAVFLVSSIVSAQTAPVQTPTGWWYNIWNSISSVWTWLFVGDNGVTYIADKVTINGIIVNGIPLSTVGTWDNKTSNTCGASRYGFDVNVSPCTIQSPISHGLKQWFDFSNTQNATRNLSAMVVFESDTGLTEGRVDVLTSVNTSYQDTITQNAWATNYLVTDVINTTALNISNPNLSCDIGNKNNTFMYLVNQNINGTNYTTKNYCLTQYSQVNATAFRLNGSYDTQVQVTKWHLVDTLVDATASFISKGKCLNDSRYDCYQVSSQIFTPYQTIRTLFTYGSNSKSGKFHIFMWESATPIQTAINTDAYLYLDPWWNNSYNYCFNVFINNTITTQRSETVADININVTSFTDKPYNDSIRVVNETCNNSNIGTEISSGVYNIVQTNGVMDSFNLVLSNMNFSENENKTYGVYYSKTSLPYNQAFNLTYINNATALRFLSPFFSFDVGKAGYSPTWNGFHNVAVWNGTAWHTTTDFSVTGLGRHIEVYTDGPTLTRTETITILDSSSQNVKFSRVATGNYSIIYNVYSNGFIRVEATNSTSAINQYHFGHDFEGAFVDVKTRLDNTLGLVQNDGTSNYLGFGVGLPCTETVDCNYRIANFFLNKISVQATIRTDTNEGHWSADGSNQQFTAGNHTLVFRPLQITNGTQWTNILQDVRQNSTFLTTLGAEQSNIGMIVTNSIPPSGSNSTSKTITFGCNATATGGNITSVVLNITNGTSLWTQSVTGLNQPQYNATFTNSTMLNGVYTWNCLAYGDTLNGTSALWNITQIAYSLPSVTWDNQQPIPLVAINSINVGVNISYNISTIGLPINVSTVNLFWIVNSTLRSQVIFVNGSVFPLPHIDGRPTNISNTFKFHIDENEFLPASYNVDDDVTDDTLHNTQTLTSNNAWIGMRFYNMTNNTENNFFEIMSNSSTSQQIYFCNSSYAFAADAVPSIVTSPRCALIGSIAAGSPYAHVHSTNSSHQVLFFSMNVSTGTINGIKTTPTGYFFLRGQGGGANTIRYYTVPIITRPDQMQLTTNNGGTYTNQSFTVDAHVHQFTANNTWFNYYACANLSTAESYSNCSILTSMLLSGGNLPPSSATITYPNSEQHLKGMVNITWIAAVSFTGYITIQNITLLNADFSYNSTINTNASGTSYMWNTSLFPDGRDFVIRLKSTDNNSLTSVANVLNLSIDNTYPKITWVTAPLNNSFINAVSVNLTVNVTELNLENVTLYLSKNDYTINSSFSGLTHIFTVSDGKALAYATACDTSNNCNTTDIRYFTVDTTSPQINIVYPLNISYNINVSALNYTVSDTNLDKCWYSLNNGATNISVSCGTNLTGLTSIEGSNTWIVWANDSTGNENYNAVTFFKDTINPQVSITYPVTNTNYTNYITQLNYTVSGADNCWYSLNAGATNTSVSCGTNITIASPTEGSFTYKVYVNDTAGNFNSSTVNFNVNLTKITLVSPVNGYVAASNPIAFTCAYSINPPAIVTNITLWTNKTGVFAPSISLSNFNFIINDTGFDWGNSWVGKSTTNGTGASRIITYIIGNAQIINVTVSAQKAFLTTDNARVTYYYSDGTTSAITSGLADNTPKVFGFTNLNPLKLVSNITIEEVGPDFGNLIIFKDITITGNLSTGYVSFLDTITQPTLWTCSITDSNNNTYFASENRTVDINHVAPSLSTSIPAYFQYNYFNPAYNNTFGLTAIASSISVAKIWYTTSWGVTVTNSTPVAGVVTLDVQVPLVSSYGDQSVTIYTNDTAGNIASVTKTMSVVRVRTPRMISGVDVYETSTQSFSMSFYNLAVPSATGTFYLGATPHTGVFTDLGSGNSQLNVTFDMPSAFVNYSTFWAWNNGTAQTSTAANLTILPINFGLCNSTLTNKLLNVSFIDEITTATLNNVTLQLTGTFYNGAGTTTKSFSFNNATGNQDYIFCTDSSINLSATFTYNYAGIGVVQYPQRTSVLTQNFNTGNITQNVFQLLKTADGISVNINVVNGVGQPLINAFVVTSTGGVNISSAYSDGVGIVNLWLSPAKSYTIFGSYLGQTGTLTITPSLGSYYLILGTSSGNQTIQYDLGVIQLMSPQTGAIQPGLRTFTYNVTSGNYFIGNVSFTLYSANGSIINTSSLTGLISNQSVQINLVHSLTTNEHIYGIGTWRPVVTNGTIPSYSMRTDWNALDDTTGNSWSILHLGDDFTRYFAAGKMYGMTAFSMNLIIFIIIFGLTGIFSYRFGLTSPLMIVGIMTGITGLFDIVLGLIQYGSSTIAFFHPATTVLAVVTLALYFREGQY